MVKKKLNTRKKVSLKTKSVLFSTLHVVLFITLVFIIIFIGTNAYLSQNAKQLKGKLFSYEGEAEFPELGYCRTHADCGAIPTEEIIGVEYGLNVKYELDEYWTFVTCQRCDFLRGVCVPATERDMCGYGDQGVLLECTGGPYPERNNFEYGAILNQYLTKEYCKKDDGGVINIPTKSGMICGRASTDKLYLTKGFDCTKAPFEDKRRFGIDEKCSKMICDIFAGGCTAIVDLGKQGDVCGGGIGVCYEGKCKQPGDPDYPWTD